MKYKKRIAVVLLLCAVSILVAWKIKPVELVDDKLLIDLDLTIQDADWGQEDSPEDDSTVQTPEESESSDEQPPKDPAEEAAEITVKIRGERVWVNDVDMKTMSTLEKYLSQKCVEDTRVYLIDDYAEAHVYKRAYEYLRLLQAEEAFEISEVMSEG